MGVNKVLSQIVDINAMYLQLEVKRLKALFNRRILWQRFIWNDKIFEGYKGIIIPDGQVDAILQKETLLADEEEFYNQNEEAIKLDEIIQNTTETINNICDSATENNVFLPLTYLENIFDLNQFEKNIILLCLATEIDSDFERLIGYLQDNINFKLPTPSLALNLFCKNDTERIKARNNFNTSPLFKFQILKFIDEHGSMLSRQFKLDERMISYLLETPLLNHQSTENFRIIKPIPKKECLYPDELKRIINLIQSMLKSYETYEKKIYINLHGPSGCGKKTLAATACDQFGFPLITININQIMNQPAETIHKMLYDVLRESYLQSAIPYFEISNSKEEKISNIQVFEQFLNNVELPFIIGSEKVWDTSTISLQKTQVSIQILIIEFETRFTFWKDLIQNPKLNKEIKKLASTFQFTSGDIKKCIETAKGFAQLRNKDNSSIKAEDLWHVARNLPRHKLGDLAQKINPIFTWDDIVLPDDIKNQLKELCQQVAYKNKVYHEWGVAKKLSRGLGLNALFSGSSGTGKTMAAEVIANELNLDMYRIDLSSVVNKYIGETEKNLRKVFDEAEKSHAILFFDEADALFGKRSEIKDSHDRYANIEINYLLQKMEEYKGLCILATNMKKSLDTAFTRRIRIAVEFPIPNAQQRKEIWKKGFEPNIPHNDIDFDFLAEHFKITGGNIRNITLNAAFLAAADKTHVEMNQVIKAIKREFKKIGKLCLESEFGTYYSIIK